MPAQAPKQWTSRPLFKFHSWKKQILSHSRVLAEPSSRFPFAEATGLSTCAIASNLSPRFSSDYWSQSLRKPAFLVRCDLSQGPFRTGAGP